MRSSADGSPSSNLTANRPTSDRPRTRAHAGVANQRSGASEAIQALPATRAGAIKTRTAALNQPKDAHITPRSCDMITTLRSMSMSEPRPDRPNPVTDREQTADRGGTTGRRRAPCSYALAVARARWLACPAGLPRSQLVGRPAVASVTAEIDPIRTPLWRLNHASDQRKRAFRRNLSGTSQRLDRAVSQA